MPPYPTNATNLHQNEIYIDIHFHYLVKLYLFRRLYNDKNSRFSALQPHHFKCPNLQMRMQLHGLSFRHPGGLPSRYFQ